MCTVHRYKVQWKEIYTFKYTNRLLCWWKTKWKWWKSKERERERISEKMYIEFDLANGLWLHIDTLLTLPKWLSAHSKFIFHFDTLVWWIHDSDANVWFYVWHKQNKNFILELSWREVVVGSFQAGWVYFFIYLYFFVASLSFDCKNRWNKWRL